MNFIAQVEEHLRDLGAEARKNHPGVKEASERAILQLRSLQNAYVSAVRHATKTGGPHPTTAIFKSQDLLRPFLLAANYPNASLKLLEISFKAMRLLIEGHAICSGDGIHLVRVWTIQAHVCASQHKPTTLPHFYPPGIGGGAASSSTQSSWFGGAFSLSSSNAISGGGGGNEVGVVSSSSGQSGTGSHYRKEYDRLAVEILACLVMLLETRDLPVSEEQWSASVALCCVLLGVETSTTVTLPQAARSTLRSVLSLLYERTTPKDPVALLTWMDLLQLATYKKNPFVELKGAFSHCSLGHTKKKSGQPSPPPPDFCLELLHEILTQHPDLFGPRGDGDAFLSTAVALMELLRSTQSFGILWRSLQLAQTMILTQHEEWKPVCRELLLELVYALVAATDACRNHEDFEDGFIYIEQGNLGEQQQHATTTKSGGRRGSANTLLLVPTKVLWKAALVLEVLHRLLSEQSHVILEEDGTLVAIVTEAISDFCTIAASCKDNMLQVVECAKGFDIDDNDAIMEPTMFHRAEEIGKSLQETGASGEINVKSTPSKKGGGSGAKSLPSTPFPPCEIGEPIWTAFHCILLVCRSLRELTNEDSDDDNDGGEDDVIAAVMDGSFAPSLAVLQHYLKRFPGSRVISQCALAGYANLADVALPVAHGTAPQRKALLSSLCKLSLPLWGKHDSASQLQDHHVRALLCLVKIVHNNYDSILSEWPIVLWTFEELSMLSIFSPKLSNDGYRDALAVSNVYARIAPLAACLSVESLGCLIDALAEISRSSIEQSCDRNADGEYVMPPMEKLPQPTLSRSESATDPRTERRGSHDFDVANPKDSIGGKLMSFAGRAISAGLGAQASDERSDEPNETKTERSIPPDQRTKNTYYDDYRRDFAKRMGESKRTTNNDVFRQLPFALVALTDVAMSNTFRFESCCTVVSKQLCSLAELSPLIRAYTMDTLAMLVTSQISEESGLPSHSEGPRIIIEEGLAKKDYWAVEEVTMKSTQPHDEANDGTRTGEPQSVPHEALLAPLCDCIQTTERVDVAEAGILALHSILEGAGHNVNGEAWTVVIDAVSSLSGDTSIYRSSSTPANRSAPEFSACCMLAFRCLKLIVDDYLAHLPPPSDSSSKGARTALLDCCSSFGSSRHDVNTSLTAIGLLWSIADQYPDPKSIDHALSRLVFLSSDSRDEVRNCSVNTLFSCIAGRGQQFSAEQWKAIVCETIFGVFDRVLLRGEVDAVDALNRETAPETKSSDQPQSRYKVAVHHSRDSEGKQWATTEVMALSGLSRVLRNFFSQLLVTVEDKGGLGGDMDGNPWFPVAWERILDFSLKAATQLGGRDTLELRKAGIDLLILCSQLSSRHGVMAIVTPARVGTNMEVVNGALRSVRETNARTQDKENQGGDISEVAKHWRETMFMESFKALGRLGSHFEDDVVDAEDDNSAYIETAQLQVMLSFSVGLGKLYECCKDEELLPMSRAQSKPLEDRFVELVVVVAKKAVGGAGSRFLTQAQRASFDLLRTMISNNSSSAAFKGLASLAGQSFLWSLDMDDEEADIDLPGSDSLGQEAAKVVADEIKTDGLPPDSKVDVLCGVLSVFVDECDSERFNAEKQRIRSYDLLVPVVQGGLEAATLMEEDQGNMQDLNELWEKVLHVVSLMLSPLHLAACCQHTPLTTNLIELLEVIRTHLPRRQNNGFCASLRSGASITLDVLSENEALGASQSESLNHYGNSLKVFKQCFSGMCDIEPESITLCSVAERALQGAAKAIESDHGDLSGDSNLGVKIALVVCETVQAFPRLESLVVAVFPLLCKLTGTNHNGLRKEVGQLLTGIDLPQVVAKAEERAHAAEERASSAEKRIASLEATLVGLREENESLQQQVAVFSASSALT